MRPINLSSPTMLSVLFFGGTVKVDGEETVLNELGCPVIYKTGEKRGLIKTRKVKKELYIKGMGLNPLAEWATKKAGIYSTDEASLKVITKRKDTEAGKLAEIVLEIRGLEKMLGTYYDGMEDKIYRDMTVKGNINHCSTDTGRTSSNKPNLQNIPR